MKKLNVRAAALHVMGDLLFRRRNRRAYQLSDGWTPLTRILYSGFGTGATQRPRLLKDSVK